MDCTLDIIRATSHHGPNIYQGSALCNEKKRNKWCLGILIFFFSYTLVNFTRHRDIILSSTNFEPDLMNTVAAVSQ